MRSLVKVAVQRPITLLMLNTALLVFGVILLSRLEVNLLPKISYPTLTLRTVYEGAAPQEVEKLVTKPLEESVGTIKGIKEIQSFSRPGQSDILMTFHWGSDMDLAGLDVREKVDSITLPLDVKKPKVLRFNPSLDPILKMSISYDSLETSKSPDTQQLITLRRLAEEKIKRQLESVEGIASVKVNGGLEDEIQVLLDQEKLRQLGLTLDDIVNLLKNNNINLSGGRIDDGGQQFLVRTLNEYRSLDTIRQTVVRQSPNEKIILSDIADIQLGFKERKTLTRWGENETITLSVYKEGDANTVLVTKNTLRQLEKIKKRLSNDIRIDLHNVQANFIEKAVSEVTSTAIMGGILAMLILYAFLRDVKSTLIISLSIPLSILISFNLMYTYDVSLNMMSLGGLALAIGLLVDNSIVVLENIARWRESHDESSDIKEMAIEGAAEVSGAITAATLTTLAVFIPLIFVQGIAGQIFKDQALTVTFALIVSLFVALTVIPSLAARGGKNRTTTSNSITRKKPWWKHILRTPFYIIILLIKLLLLLGKCCKIAISPLVFLTQWSFEKIAKGYQVLIYGVLKRPIITLFSASLIFISALLLIPHLKLMLIPELNQGELVIAFRTPNGTSLQVTDKKIQQLAAQLIQHPDIGQITAISGGNSRDDTSSEVSREHEGELFVSLNPPFNAIKEQKVITAIREAVNQLPDVSTEITRPQLFSFKTPVEVEITGYNLEQLKTMSQILVEQLKNDLRFTDIKNTMEEGRPELNIVFDHDKAAQLGLSVPHLSQQLNKSVKGTVATRYTFRDEKIDILVRLQDSQRQSIEQIQKIIVNPGEERPILLGSIANVAIQQGPAEILRSSQERVAIVSANLSFGDLKTAEENLTAILQNIEWPQEVEAYIAGQNEEMQQSYQSLMMALALAIFLVYLVMASQFESIVDPLLIIFSIPLAGVGSIFLLYLTSTPVSVIVMIGLIMLAGIVVNNAIVLVDRIRQKSLEGFTISESIIDATTSRLRPIIMTTLTTILGMLPLAITVGEGSEIRQPLALTVIGGLALSTLLTLVVIPALYYLTHGKKTALTLNKPVNAQEVTS
ncbi:MAG: efflux RND transporter permease subunit [Pseudomonadota bacterium]